MNLQIYRNEQLHLSLPIDENTVFSQAVMGEHVITSQFISEVPLDIDEGDYVVFRSERFTLNRPFPPVEKQAMDEFIYTLVFEGPVYDLLDMPYMHLGALEFSYFGTPRMYLQILIDCMNSIGSGWTIGDVDDLPEQGLSFYESGKGFKCKGALVKIAEAFKLEFWLTGKKINLTKQAGTLTNLTFEYGQGRGLYSINRGQINDAAYFNRLYIQGSEKNIPAGYRNSVKRLQIDLPYLELPLTGGKKRRASSVVIDDIFPKRVGSFTSVSTDWLTLIDNTIDFDVNGQRIEGQKATIEVITGENAGRSFEIASYNSTSKGIVITPIVEADGYTYPNSTFAFAPGDQYFFAGIVMPATYVQAAEAELKAKGLELLQEGANHVPPYSVAVQDHFMKANGIQVNAGDRVGLRDTQLGVDSKIRVSSVKFPIVNQDQIDLLISDVVTYSTFEKTIIDLDKTKQEVVTIDKTNVELARRAALNLRSLENSIFDTDGLFDVDKFNVGVLKTALGIFGAASSNFILKSVYVNINFQGDPNAINITQGTLSHLEIKNPNGQADWLMAASTRTGLIASSLYYIYAKCSRTSQNGTFLVTGEQITYDSDPSFYHFLMGVVYPVNGSYRDSDMSYGITSINGNRIKTGRIESVDGQTWFDLNSAEFHGKFTFTSGKNVQQDINEKASAAQNAAVAYANAQDVYNLTVSNAYADGKVTAEEQARINEAANNLAAAKADATAKANAAQSNAQAYANAQIQAVNQDIADVNDRINDLDTGIDQAFFDGLISEAEANSIKKYINTLDTERADVDNRYNVIYNDPLLTGTAKNNLASAKGAYNGAHVALISSINTAISDGKATEAESADVDVKFASYRTAIANLSTRFEEAINGIAQGKVNAIQVGGRNYFRKTTLIDSLGNLLDFNHAIESDPFGFGTTNGIWSVGIQDRVGGFRVQNIINGNGEWVVSGYLNSNGGFYIYIDICDGPQQAIWIEANKWTKFSLKFNVTTWSSDRRFVDFDGIPWAYFLVKDLKIEEGNKATDWTPAPEDVQADAQARAAAAQAASKAYSDAQDAYNLIVANAHADGLVTAEEQARINQAAANLAAAKADAEAKADAAKASANGYTDTKSQATLTAAQTYADSAALSKANIAQAAAIQVASTDAQTRATTAQNAAVALSQQLVDSIKIGGRNLMLNGDFSKGLTYWNPVGTALSVVANGYALINQTATGSGGIFQYVSLTAGLHTLSADLFIEAYTEIPNIGFEGVLLLGGTGYSIVYNQWHRITITAYLESGQKSVIAYCGSGNRYRIRKVKVEQGTKATDWTPAVEDVQFAIDAAKSAADAAQNAYSNLTGSLKSMAYQDVVELSKLGSTVIQNGYLRTTLIDVAYLKANVINAGYINSLEIFANKLQTVNTGNGYIAIEGNTIRSYNPNGNLGRKQTIENGVVKDVWYTVDGVPYFEVGQNGIVYYNGGGGNFPDTPTQYFPVAYAYKTSNWQQGCTYMNGSGGGNITAYVASGGVNHGKYYDDGSGSTPCNGFYYAKAKNDNNTYEFTHFSNGVMDGAGDCLNGWTPPTS